MKLPIPIRDDELRAICEKYQVRELLAFGSVVRDDFRPDSDVDLLVEFQPDARVGFFKFFDLQTELQTLVGRKVDLVSKRGLNPFIEREVLDAARSIYAAA